MARGIRPATADDALHVEQVVLCLRVARHHARLAQCPSTLRKIQSALKSAEGAKRHLARRLGVTSSEAGLTKLDTHGVAS